MSKSNKDDIRKDIKRAERDVLEKALDEEPGWFERSGPAASMLGGMIMGGVVGNKIGRRAMRGVTHRQKMTSLGMAAGGIGGAALGVGIKEHLEEKRKKRRMMKRKK